MIFPTVSWEQPEPDLGRFEAVFPAATEQGPYGRCCHHAKRVRARDDLDTDARTAQVAVFALRADQPEAFSIPYFALANEGGFKAIHLMGYVDLPDMKTPTAIAVAGDNGNTPGGHVPGFEYGSQTDPTKNS